MDFGGWKSTKITSDLEVGFETAHIKPFVIAWHEKFRRKFWLLITKELINPNINDSVNTTGISIISANTFDKENVSQNMPG